MKNSNDKVPKSTSDLIHFRQTWTINRRMNSVRFYKVYHWENYPIYICVVNDSYSTEMSRQYLLNLHYLDDII